MSTIVIAEQARIPGWVNSLSSFRKWARSPEFPRRGWFSFLDGEIWVDTSMDELFTHNRVKTRFTSVLEAMSEEEELGYVFSDRALLTNAKANLSTEPDGMFVSFSTIERGRVKLVRGKKAGFVEVSGTPDMVIEVVSENSVAKDTVELPLLYWKARIPEYWLIDARPELVQFSILRRAARGYVKTTPRDGWLHSRVFDRAFMLETKKDRLGNRKYVLTTQK